MQSRDGSLVSRTSFFIVYIYMNVYVYLRMRFISKNAYTVCKLGPRHNIPLFTRINDVIQDNACYRSLLNFVNWQNN